MPPLSILVIRLACRKVYPTGPVYLISLLRRVAPHLPIKLLDLALVNERERESAVRAAIHEFDPAVIAFSWRDIQIFSPQDTDGGFRDAFIFFHDPSITRKIGASLRGLRDILMYRSALGGNLNLIRKITASYPGIEIAVGGPSVKIFGPWIEERLPQRVRLFPEISLARFFEFLDFTLPEDEIEPHIELKSIEASFPQWTAYRDEIIGIQTKRGCPHSCLYCLYGRLEGRMVSRREPDNILAEISAYAGRWGARQFWFADSQLLCDATDRNHLYQILDGILKASLDIEWSGYLRVHELDGELASLMVRSGLRDIEISLGSGAQSVVDELRLGFDVETLLKGCHTLKAAGYSGKVLVNLSLNAPGETHETLLKTVEVLDIIKTIFGDEKVMPVVFFLAIQPGTRLEKRAIADGHLDDGYDPLSVLPWNIRKLIYNPPPLGRMIGRSCARAFRDGGINTGKRILESIATELGAIRNHNVRRQE